MPTAARAKRRDRRIWVNGVPEMEITDFLVLLSQYMQKSVSSLQGIWNESLSETFFLKYNTYLKIKIKRTNSCY